MAAQAFATVPVPAAKYRVTWRIGEFGTVEHIVVGQSAEEARQISQTIIREVAGIALEQWRLEAIRKPAENPPR